MEKPCRLCGEVKPLDEFYARPGAKDGHRGDCKECCKSNHLARYHGDLDKVRRHQRELRGRNRENVRRIARESRFRCAYGIEIADRDRMVQAQDNKCAICGDPVLVDGTVTGHVDHDHVTGKVRSILCMSCNTGLGQFKDSPQRLRQAAAYIETHHG